jgi:hypothetical protein
VSLLRAESSHPACRLTEIDGDAHKQHSQVVLCALGVTVDAYTLTTHQSRQTAFDPAAVQTILGFEGFRLLTQASSLKFGIIRS